MTLDVRETASVLAALRLLQRQPALLTEIDDIATNCGVFSPLDDDEIDALCERINCEGDHAQA